MVAGVVKMAAVSSRRVLLGLRAYARHRAERGLVGRTLHAVQRAIADGRITPIDGRIDPEVADIQWAEKTDAVQQARGARGGHAPRPDAEPPRSVPAPAGDRDGYFATKERRERAEAELAELELQERRRELVRAADVERVTFEANRAVRDRVMGIADRVAPIVAAEADVARCHEVIANECRAALRDVVQALAEAA